MSSNAKQKPIVLAIAGFDPSGGAGIIADVRTIHSFSCVPVAAITSITFQNAESYLGAIHQTASSVRAQVEAIVAEHKIDAVKIAMLPTAEVVREVGRLIREFDLPAAVIDPVMDSTSGGKLMADDAFKVFVTELLPLTRLVTPNIPEAEKLAGVNIRDEGALRQAAARIRELGAQAVLIKGGHQYRTASESERVRATPEEREAIDVLDDGGAVTVFRSEWIDVPNVRGTGCMLSSAIAAALAKGKDLRQAVKDAKEYVSQAIQNAQLER